MSVKDQPSPFLFVSLNQSLYMPKWNSIAVETISTKTRKIDDAAVDAGEDTARAGEMTLYDLLRGRRNATEGI